MGQVFCHDFCRACTISEGPTDFNSWRHVARRLVAETNDASLCPNSIFPTASDIVV